MDLTSEAVRFLTYISALFVIVRVLISSLSNRVDALEKEAKDAPKRSIKDCENAMLKCPVQTRLCGIEKTLTEIKGDVKDVQRDIKDHVKFHLEGDK